MPSASAELFLGLGLHSEDGSDVPPDVSSDTLHATRRYNIELQTVHIHRHENINSNLASSGLRNTGWSSLFVSPLLSHGKRSRSGAHKKKLTRSSFTASRGGGFGACEELWVERLAVVAGEDLRKLCLLSVGGRTCRPF
jgi:hypothetical protein